ncbi:ABC transporter permease [Dyadobacter chenhuakuii]|uniref:ABC transporter permease n=1 Tax=Dyadobacter chenhuakuii TaxID=2909339 RepID=A0A9X1QCG7_9BACT|nr:ABC transporter permease [Dyadobacter chenhuakuii]MCF2492162.1 ABC transporter permease [Dyadobacter chenhuakuii]MCF2498479.1 ABC transporter permease [Dyadobacter chenhuakuii]USJ28682.1 ABC transporter permease [Dyadobacter chenhuakuii]
MRNIFLVIRREYLVRVKKKSFLIMTLLGPLLFVAFYGVVIWVAVGSVDTKTVQVLDESGLFRNEFKNSETLKFAYLDSSIDSAKVKFKNSDANALVYIPKNVIKEPKSVRIYAAKNVSMDLKSEIEKVIEKEIENIKLEEAGITHKILEDSRVNVSSETISLSEEGEKTSSSGAATVIGGICAFLIYMSVFIYGTQVMRGITEEKTSRIVEVIISSVKPFQLMLGKIIGVALVGLTQFVLWILLTTALTSATSAVLSNQMSKESPEMAQEMEKVQKGMPGPSGMPGGNVENPVAEVLGAINSLNIPLILGCFLFYYLGGYLLYSALFGAVGAAVDNDADTQQFMLPITLPIIFSFVFAQFVLRDPDGTLAFWTSIIPFTSPIIMMVRIPFGVPAWEIALSMVLLVLGFMGTTWLAARIYRVGILMYGKKVSYRELAKWIFYK